MKAEVDGVAKARVEREDFFDANVAVGLSKIEVDAYVAQVKSEVDGIANDAHARVRRSASGLAAVVVHRDQLDLQKAETLEAQSKAQAFREALELSQVLRNATTHAAAELAAQVYAPVPKPDATGDDGQSRGRGWRFPFS